MCIVCDTFGCCNANEQHTYGDDCLCQRKPMTDQEYVVSERKKTAERLKLETMEIAAAFETIAHEDDERKVKAAQAFLRDQIEGYWHAVKIGNGSDMQKVLAWDENDL